MRRTGLARWVTAFAAAGLLVPGCKDEGGQADTGADTGSTGGTTGVDTGTTGGDATATGTGDTGGEMIEFELEDIYGVPNLDDDDENGKDDWFEYVFDGDNDPSALPIPGVPDGYEVELVFTGDIEFVRVWDGQTIAIGMGQDTAVDSYTFSPGPEGATLDVEFGGYNAKGTLAATVFDPEGNEAASTSITLHGAPLIMNHHLQPTEHVWVVEVQAGFGDNLAMVADYTSVLGDLFTPVPGSQYGYDVWIQDEVEFSHSTAPDGQRLNTVIDSIRDRGLDPFAENMVVAPDFIAETWGNPAQTTTWDSFGNLEASPPVTVGGVEYPFGRIYYGKMGTTGIHQDMADFLIAQQVQAPVELDTFWLCVGHVDEFSSFVPDPSSEKGFKLLLSDVPSAYALLESLDPNMTITRYGADHGYPTVGDILADTGLRALNEDLQADEIDPIRAVFESEFGVEDSDIILIPSLFETIGGCGGGTAALMPGMVNLIVANPEGDDTHLFIPDPFFRTDVNDQNSDPIIADFASRMPEGLQLHFVDNWDVYHLGLGEVHCGTNVQRTPTEDWWTAAMHLLEE